MLGRQTEQLHSLRKIIVANQLLTYGPNCYWSSETLWPLYF